MKLRNDAPAWVLPAHWTPAQALAAWECLSAVREALWAQYGAQMQQAWREQLTPESPLPGIDSEAPF